MAKSTLTLEKTLKDYFKNEGDIDLQDERIARLGRGSIGISETFLNGAPNPIPAELFNHLETIFEYSRLEMVKDQLLSERARLGTIINHTLKRIPGKKILFKTTKVTIVPPNSTEITVALWSDGNQLFTETFNP